MIWTHRGRFAYGLRSSLWRAAGIDDPQGGDLGLGQVAAPSPPGERVCAGVKSRAYPFIHALIWSANLAVQTLCWSLGNAGLGSSQSTPSSMPSSFSPSCLFNPDLSHPRPCYASSGSALNSQQGLKVRQVGSQG